MKILHFNTYDTGGAAQAAWSFHLSLIENGHQSMMMVRNKTRSDAGLIEFKIEGVLSFLKYKFYKASSNIIKTDPGYFFYNYREKFHFPTQQFVKQLPFTPDIICVHWVTGFINAQNLYELSQATGAPIIWRFNDMNAFTGGCHYSNGCTNYFTTCGKCPALLSSNPKDRSYENLQEKIKWLSKTNISFLSSTTEIDEQLRNSVLAKFTKTYKIMLGCRQEFFNYQPDKNLYRKELGLPEGKKIIFFGAQNINDKRKGYTVLLEALHVLKTKITVEASENILLVYASQFDGVKEEELPFKSIRLPFMKGEEEIAKLYKIADVLVSPSIEDAGPMMLLESMLCGTPAVTFTVGLAKDAVINNVNGFIVPTLDVDKFAEGIKQVLIMEADEYRSFSQNCAEKTAALFGKEKEIANYEELFRELVKNK